MSEQTRRMFDLEAQVTELKKQLEEAKSAVPVADIPIPPPMGDAPPEV